MRPDQVPGWVDQSEFLQNACTLAACLLFPNTSALRRTAPRFLLDVALTTVAGFVLAVYFLVQLNDRSGGEALTTLVVAGAIADWLLFVVMAIGFARKQDGRVRNTMGWLLLAHLVYLLANHIYDASPVYHVGDAVDGLWFAAWGLRWIAARHAWRGYDRDGAGDLVASPGVLAYRSSLFSYVIVAGAFLLVLVQLVVDRRHIEISAFSASLMASILLVRQFAEIQENRRLFDERLSQEARFRSLVQQSSDVVLVVDPEGVVQYVSASAARVFGSPSPVIPGVLLRAVVTPTDGTSLAQVLEPGSRPARPLAARVRGHSGDWRDVEIVWSDLRSDQTVSGIVLSCRDVTERNELERRLQHAQKLDAVGHLAGGLAHDFNNVLTVIRGYTELLRADLPEDSPAGTDLTHMEQAVDRASAVTKKLLAFSRRQAVQPVVLDLNAVVRDLQPIFRQLLTDGVEVDLALAPDLWPVKADAGQLEQVLINLATNARDAMPQGGRLRVATANLAPAQGAAFGARPRRATCRSPSPIPAAGWTMRRRRVSSTRSSPPSPRIAGMGLGLAMVHGIVYAAGGHIDVRSAPGEGATFTILLPRTDEVPLPARTPDETPERTLRPVTVLVVDDEPGVRAVARRFLETSGYEVLEAEGGGEAVAFIDDGSRQIDVVLTDMVMPGVTGREVIARVRAVRPGTPVIVMTGFAGESRDAADSSGIAAVVTKPFSAGVLVRAVASVHDRGAHGPAAAGRAQAP